MKLLVLLLFSTNVFADLCDECPKEVRRLSGVAMDAIASFEKSGHLGCDANVATETIWKETISEIAEFSREVTLQFLPRGNQTEADRVKTEVACEMVLTLCKRTDKDGNLARGIFCIPCHEVVSSALLVAKKCFSKAKSHLTKIVCDQPGSTLTETADCTAKINVGTWFAELYLGALQGKIGAMIICNTHLGCKY